MARRHAADATEAELALLRGLWDRGPSTIRQLAEGVYGEGGTSTYATVQKLLERLEAKGLVGRDRSESVHVFSARIGRDELIGRRLRAVAETLCGGSLAPLVSHLVQGGGLSASERDEIRALIERLDPDRGDRTGSNDH
jgi:predicted transcriptional regulator